MERALHKNTVTFIWLKLNKATIAQQKSLKETLPDPKTNISEANVGLFQYVSRNSPGMQKATEAE